MSTEAKRTTRRAWGAKAGRLRRLLPDTARQRAFTGVGALAMKQNARGLRCRARHLRVDLRKPPKEGLVGARTIHPFPARMAPEIALDHIGPATSGMPMLVLDPMCGSGTVLSAASERGHSAIGLDMDPLAVLMADVATTPLDASALRSAAFVVERRASQSRARRPPWSDDETDSFARYWFGSQQLKQLVRVVRAIDEADDLACPQCAPSRPQPHDHYQGAQGVVGRGHVSQSTP